MVLRRSDSRRRRLVVDPSQSASEANEKGAPPTDSENSSNKKKKDVRAYSYGADRRNVNKTTDFFPKRVISYLLVVFVLLACLGLVNYGAIQSNRWVAKIGEQGASSFAISGPGSVAGWFASFLLILSSLASLQIFALRKHRCDDYRGTYRLWVWMSGVLLFASLCCIVNLGSIAVFVFESLTHVSSSEKPWLVPTIVISLLTILVARAAFEVRRSRGSMAWMATVWVGFTVAVLLQLPQVRGAVLMEFGAEMVAGNCVLFATAALLMAHLTYVRFIFLRAHGLIKLKPKKKKVAKPKIKSKTVAQSKSKSKSASTSKSKSKTKAIEKKTAKSKSKSDAEPSENKVAAKKTKTKTKLKPKKAKKAVEAEPVENVENGKEKKSASDLLKEMAAASRAKEQSRSSQDYAEEDEHEDHESPGVIKMSKAQRRKQRKQQRSNKRAA